MNWRLIVKDPQKQPSEGTYKDWKEQIADECFHQCVYCSIHENPWGGIDHYHIDHYRPKSIIRFKHLENDICNLFYACPVCNKFKLNDWPGEPDDLQKICYPDPSITNYQTLFNLDMTNYSISSSYISGQYLINRLYLNRPQLVYERREGTLKQLGAQLINEITTMLKNCEDIAIINKALTIINDVIQHLSKRDRIRPYRLADIRKP